jgi:hypothetical protein
MRSIDVIVDLEYSATNSTYGISWEKHSLDTENCCEIFIYFEARDLL